MSLAAGLAGLGGGAMAEDPYGDTPMDRAAGPPPQSPHGGGELVEHTVLRDAVPIYQGPTTDPTQQIGVVEKGLAVQGVQEDAEDGTPMLRAQDDEGEYWIAVRNERGERNVQSAVSRLDASQSAARPSDLGRTFSRFGEESNLGAGSFAQQQDMYRTKSVVRRPVNNRTLRSFRMNQALNTHALKDSEQVCVGASVKRMHVPRCLGNYSFSINAEFMIHIEWAARGAVGVLIAALPSFLQYGWLREMRSGTFDFDPTYAAVAFVFVFSETVGQTIKHCYQACVGAFVAAVVPQLAINTFGDDETAVLLFMLFYSMFVLSLPIEQVTQKFSLGMCMMYLMRRAKGSSDGLSIPKSVTYQVMFLGFYGCFVALLVCYIPFPRTAITQAFKGIKNCVTDIQFCTRNLVEAYISGENLQDRARTLKYFEHMVTELRDLEHNIDFAFWEPWSQGKVQKYKAVLYLIHKLRTDLYGMQKALMKRTRDGMHRDIMEKRCFVVDPRTNQNTDSQEFQECLRDLMLTSLRCLREVVTYVAGEGEMEWLQSKSARMSKEKMREKIEADIVELKELRIALDRFHMDYASIRSDFSVKAEEDRVERDAYLNVFLFNLTSYAQALMDFPADYAAGLEQAQTTQHVFLPETKQVTFSFQKRMFISALKTSAAIFAVALLNMLSFEYSYISPVLVAYVMAGHVGGSWANTGDRIMGIIFGMMSAFFFTIFTECFVYWTAAGFGLVSLLSFYVRISSRNHEYVGVVAGFVQCLIMVDHSTCTTDTKAQLDVVEQIVLSCLAIGACEFMDFGGASSALFYRKQVADTMLDCLSIFKEVFDSHVSVNLDQLKMRQKKDVDMALWRGLPNSLYKQEGFLTSAMMEPTFHRQPEPFSAYHQLTTCGRRLNLHLILLHRALERISKLREEKNRVEAFREQKLLFDDLVADDDNMQQQPGAEVIELRSLINECFEELSGSVRQNLVLDKVVEHTGDNADEIDIETRENMVGLDELREDEEDWFMPMHPTGSENFKKLAKESQKVMKRVYSFSPDARSCIRKQMAGLGAWVGDKELATMKIKNGDLMTFHATALSVREFVMALLEADQLVWGGDAGWLNSQFQ